VPMLHSEGRHSSATPKVATFGNIGVVDETWVSPIGARVADDIAEWEANDPEFRALRQRRPYADLAKLIIRLRTVEGLSQEELARRMGTTKAAISRLESGRHRPTVETLRRLAEAVGGRLTITIVMPDSSERGIAARHEAVAL
jgi:ribosome-binding protein aMBF1 (putative translation factor)